MRPPGHQFLHRAVKLPAIVESRAKHDLRMILDVRRLQAVEMVCNLSRPPRVEHGSAQIGIHRMDGNEERRQVIAFDPLEILFAHIRQRDEVAIEERHAIIVILDRQALSHTGRHLIDEAEVTAVAARAYAIENGGSELCAKFFIIVLVEGKQFLLTVCMFDEKLDLLFGESKAQIDDVAQFLPIDGKNLVSRCKLQFFRQASRRYAYDFP